MDLNFTEASSLAAIDHQIETSNHNFSPAQYEIIRQVIYNTADFEYFSLLKFSEEALSQGAEALTTRQSIVVDVPEIQVSIVPKLQQTFCNPVYCCATTKLELAEEKTGETRAASGLEVLAKKHPQAIFIIGQDQTTLAILIKLLEKKIINPSLVIVTAPVFVIPETKQSINNYSIANIYVNSPKGGATVASAIFNSLVKLAWQVFDKQIKD